LKDPNKVRQAGNGLALVVAASAASDNRYHGSGGAGVLVDGKRMPTEEERPSGSASGERLLPLLHITHSTSGFNHGARSKPAPGAAQAHAICMQVASRYGSFRCSLEARRECVRDAFDLPGLAQTLKRVQDQPAACGSGGDAHHRRSSLRHCFSRTLRPSSTTATRRWWSGGCRRRWTQSQLCEALLGDAEPLALLDAESIEPDERGQQRLLRPARGLDGLHDLLGPKKPPVPTTP
jgi:hypothetical protein